MSYLGPNRTSAPAGNPTSPAGTTPDISGKPSGNIPRNPPRAASDTSGLRASALTRYNPGHEVDWQQVAVFGAGLALGILVGAGAALLTAPQSGAETRDELRRGAQRTTKALGRRSRHAWFDLRDELRDASDSIRRRTARRLEERAMRRELARESRG